MFAAPVGILRTPDNLSRQTDTTTTILFEVTLIKHLNGANKTTGDVVQSPFLEDILVIFICFV